MRLGETRKTEDRFHWQHLLAWLGGVFCATVPFIGWWEIGTMQMPVRHGAGHFGFNVLTATGLCIIGGVVCGSWWRLSRWLMGSRDLPLTLLSMTLFFLGITGWVLSMNEWMHDHLKAPFFYTFAGILVLGLAVAFFARSDRRRQLGGFTRWMSERKRANVVFFTVMFIVLVASNVIFVLGMDISWLEKTSALIGRVFTCGVLAGIFYLLAELTMRATPRFFRWTTWLVISMIPLIIIADQWMSIALGRRFIEFVNGLTASGDFDPVVELAASGLDVGPVGAIFLVIGVLAGSLGIAWGAWVLSKVWNLQLSVGKAISFVIICWLVVIAEQGLGSKWKTTASWQSEHKVFDLQIGVFSPPHGLGRYNIVFYPSGDPEFKGETEELVTKPDIFIFMVESMRGDAMREDITPFMWKFNEEECQPFGSAWAGSNGTHLSWYSFFHSQVPVHWRETLEQIGEENHPTYEGAPPLRLLKNLGYEIQARAVCDLEYKKFGLLNFGGGNTLAAVLHDSEEGTEFAGLNIPEREMKTFEALRNAVSERSQGGGLFFTALDSPHYNYYWHESFTPPFSDYEEDIRFPFNPDQEEIDRYLRRYWNACAWVDHQIKEFCDYLKREGRYDNSIIIITGDHGEEFQEQGSWCHCSTLEPEQTQVPLLIKWSKNIGRGPKQKIASHMDVMPTLLSALNVSTDKLPLMAGQDLFAEKRNQHTIISTTAYAGKTGETMVLRNGDYTAYFSWPRYWEAQVPEKIVLERISGPDGSLLLGSPAAYLEALKTHFPDAFERYIKSMEVVED
ncbi:MAG: sulfatase-like hydrolase/transferase [Akkermansiaceae bacterium]